MWPSWVFGFSGFQSAPPINSTLPKGESMGPHWLGSPWYNLHWGSGPTFPPSQQKREKKDG